MATLTITSVIQQIEQLVGGAFQNRNNKDHWQGDVKDTTSETIVTIKSVSIEAVGFKFVFTLNGTDHTIEATPGVSGMSVKLDGTAQPDAHVVFRPVPSFAHPARYHLDFRPVNLNGKVVRVEFAFQ